MPEERAAAKQCVKTYKAVAGVRPKKQFTLQDERCIAKNNLSYVSEIAQRQRIREAANKVKKRFSASRSQRMIGS